MRRSALECFQRGVLSTRANWPLIAVAVLQNLVVTVLFLASLLPPFLVLGGAALLGEGFGALDDPAALESWLTGLGGEAVTRLGALALGVLGSLLIGVLAVVVWAWFQGGIVGVLVGAERQAHPEAQGRRGGWQWFKTFSWNHLSGWGGRNVWRFFWFFHLMITVWMVFFLVTAVFLVGAGLAWERWGGGGAFGLGCGGSIPLVFLFWVLAAWSLLAQPAVALPESGALRGSVLGFRVLGHRLGAASLLLLLMIVVSVALSLAIGLGRMAFDLVLGDRLALSIGLYLVTALGQSIVAAALNVFVLAGDTALVAAQVEAEPGSPSAAARSGHPSEVGAEARLGSRDEERGA